MNLKHVFFILFFAVTLLPAQQIHFRNGGCIKIDSLHITLQNIWFENDSQAAIIYPDSNIEFQWLKGPFAARLPCIGSCNRYVYFTHGFELKTPSGTLKRYYNAAEKTAFTWMEFTRQKVEFYENDGYQLSLIQTDSGQWLGEWQRYRKNEIFTEIKAPAFRNYLPFPFLVSPYNPGYQTEPTGTWKFQPYADPQSARVYRIIKSTIKGNEIFSLY